ncbi:MAG: signal peptidase I [Desulfovibrio sp.]|uniref:signal peptidase I n=1 Tax=Desulfovibrio sp. 7SRBS1 TaxID=3378064 RepID=UPI003B3C8961
MNPKFVNMLKETTEALIIAIVLALFIRGFVVQAFKIPSGSMLETLQIGDHLLVNKFIYGIKIPFTDINLIDITKPKDGDIVVFRYPGDPSIDYIKRVMGSPGDTIEIRNKRVYRNGELLEEPYVNYAAMDPYVRPIVVDGPPDGPGGLPACPGRDNIKKFTVPEGKYFMMGDNRDHSSDSRCWGFVDRSAIIGKAWIIYWSWEGPTFIRWNRIGRILH